MRPSGLPLVGFVPPLLPTLVDEPPAGPGWVHEIKHDGWRSELAINGDRVQAFTRRGIDYSRQFAPIVAEAKRLGCSSALIDGEIIVQDEQGRSDFGSLKGAMAGQQHRLIFYAFDLLHLDGEDLRRLPLLQRKAKLQNLVGARGSVCPIQYSEAVEGDGAAVFRAACRMELEGIISKKADSRYRSGRSTAWLKVKCYDEGQFIVLGAEHEPGKPAFALLARETPTGLEYAGSAFVTLAGLERDRFWNEIERLSQARPDLKVVGHKKARWVCPEMRVHVQHLRCAGMLRHATVRGIVS